MEWKTEDFLSQEEIKQIMADELRAKIAKDSERILSNIGYQVAFAVIDSAMTPDQLSVVRAKAVEVCQSVDKHDVFRRPDAWHREASPAHQVLNDTINECRPIIVSRVKEAIAEYSFRDEIKASSAEYLAEALIEALRVGLSK
jgi:hypothetical protein